MHNMWVRTPAKWLWIADRYLAFAAGGVEGIGANIASHAGYAGYRRSEDHPISAIAPGRDRHRLREHYFHTRICCKRCAFLHRKRLVAAIIKQKQAGGLYTRNRLRARGRGLPTVSYRSRDLAIGNSPCRKVRLRDLRRCH